MQTLYVKQIAKVMGLASIESSTYYDLPSAQMTSSILKVSKKSLKIPKV